MRIDKLESVSVYIESLSLYQRPNNLTILWGHAFMGPCIKGLSLYRGADYCACA
jgi:hypothetical protein